MNRLIIIGNGFDLAHGMKTSFYDFISDYFCNAVNSFFDNGSYSDILLEIYFKNDLSYFKPKPNPGTIDTVYEEIDKLKKEKDVNFIFNSLLLNKVYS